MGVRRQIYLDDYDETLLKERSSRSGLSVSELIRQAVHRCYGPGRQLSWDEVFAKRVVSQPATSDAWLYDQLFDDFDASADDGSTPLAT